MPAAKTVRKLKVGKEQNTKLQSNEARALEIAKEKKFHLNKEDMKIVIDAGAEATLRVKELNALLKFCKAAVLATGEKSKWAENEGSTGKVKIAPSTANVISTAGLLRKLVKLGKKKLFPSVFKVAVGEAKKYLGEEELKDITTTTTEKYGSVAFKRK